MPGFELIGDEERSELLSIFDSGGVLFRHGFDAMRQGTFKVADFERAFADRMGAPHALAVTSGTSALRVALAALGVGKGDSVLIPAFTFVATAEAVIEAGAVPVCVEIDSTLNMDPEDLKSKIRPNSKCVIVVHMLGVPSDLRRITAVCRESGLDLIEDTAWGCGGSLEGRPLGTWGRMGTFSFDFAKALTTGEGGMILFQDETDYRNAAAWHDHGHENNPAVPRWEDTRHSSGFNYRMTEMQGAVGLAQLRKLSRILDAQAAHANKLREALVDVDGVVIREEPIGSDSTNDAFVFSVPSALAARRVREEVLAIGLSTKILPEAMTWHFAGDWSHMTELVEGAGGTLDGAFSRSRELLSQCVALPVMVEPPDVSMRALRDAVVRAIG